MEMVSLSAEVSAEYQRWVDIVGLEDPYLRAGTLGIHDVLRAHFCLADFFLEEGSGLGGVGPKDLNLLHSAVYRQHVAFGGQPKWSNIYELAATLFYGLIKDHPFHDANKRTAFLCCLYQLEKSGKCLTISHKNFEDFTVEVAERKLSRYRRFSEMRRTGPDAEVLFISDYLRRNSRNIDKSYHRVTYRQLNSILQRFGYRLDNPRNNYIDVLRTEERRKIFGLMGKKERIDVRVCQIGFPNWNAEVGKGAIKTVRTKCQLTYRDGIDSVTFFRDADPIDCIIARYQEPLRNLAGR